VQLKIAEVAELKRHRQTLIKLADSSEARWRTVEEYDKTRLHQTQMMKRK
jgi:hypothetical protein